MKLSLNDFTIELCDYYIDESGSIVERPIRLSSLIEGETSTTGVYDEKLVEKTNSQYTLTFNIQAVVDGSRNPLMEFIVNDRKVRLKQKDSKNIEFFITDKAPSFNNKSTSYAITCQDAFSYQLSRQSINLSLSTNDEAMWGEDNIGPKSIDELTSKVLELARMSDWHVNADINNHIYQFPNNLYANTEPMRVSLEIDKSTPYNIILEIAKLFNAIIVVDYDLKEINFLNKEKATYRGLKLKPNVNLNNNFSYKEQGANLYNIMYVSGGEDAYGNYLSIAPSMPLNISKIITETAKENCIPDDFELSISNYYIAPTFYRGFNGELLKKNYNSGSPLYQTTGIHSYWEDSNDINELQNFILSCYNLLETTDKNESDFNEFSLFFKKLQRIPHAGSFLYNFDYWKNNKLLSNARYNNLTHLFNHDMRNINLKLIAYLSTYNIFNYELSSLVRQEEELIALMAAESSVNANNLTDSATASYLRYLSECEWFGDENQLVSRNAYLPVGIVSPSDKARQYILYGRGLGNSYLGYTLPDFIGGDLNYYGIRNNIPIKLEVARYNRAEESFIISNNCPSDKVYVKYEDLKTAIQSKDNVRVVYNTNGISDTKLTEYQYQLAALWDDKYRFYYRSIYGDNWLSNKLQTLINKRADYINKKKEVENKLIAIFGDNWAELDSSSFPSVSNLYIEYSDLVAELEQLSVYVGGKGTRKYSNTTQYYEYKGIYNYYISALESLYGSEVAYNSEPLCDIVDRLRQMQNALWNELYKNYSDVIRETHYDDSTQITDDGLYAAAFKQFLTYQQPTKSYSSSYITNYDLESTEEYIEIGDSIELYHDYLKDVVDPKSFIIKSDKLPPVIDEVVIHYDEPRIEQGVIKYNTYYETVLFELLDNKLLIQTNKYKNFDIDSSIIKEIYINNKVFNAYNYNSIESIEKVFKQEPVSLRITGITKELRSKIVQLEVEENTLYNTLVDRLIYFLQK